MGSIPGSLETSGAAPRFLSCMVVLADSTTVPGTSAAKDVA